MTINDILDDILGQTLTPVTPDSPFDEDLFQSRIHQYKTALNEAKPQEILALLKNKIFMTSPNENWNFIPIDLVILTYKKFFNQPEIQEVLSQLASYISFVSDIDGDISSEIFKLIGFLKT